MKFYLNSLIKSAAFMLYFSFSLTACQSPSDNTHIDKKIFDSKNPFGVVPDHAPLSAGTLAALGNEKGNGGDVVVCFSTLSVRDDVKNILTNNKYSSHPTNPFDDSKKISDISNIRILDLYEYELPIGFPPQQRKVMTASTSPFTEIPNLLFKKMATKNELGSILQKNLETIPYTHWVASPGVIEIDDSNEAFIVPSNCLIVQMAVRRDDYVYYDLNLFNRLSEIDKAALVVHEIVYKTAVELGQNNSAKARKVSGLLMSETEMDQLSSLSLYQQLSEFGDFAFLYPIFNQEVFIKNVSEYFPNGAPKKFSFLNKETTLNLYEYDFSFVDAMSFSEPDQLNWLTGRFSTQASQMTAPVEVFFDNNQIIRLTSKGTPLQWHSLSFNNITELNFTNQLVHSFKGEFYLSSQPNLLISEGEFDQNENLVLAKNTKGYISSSFLRIRSTGEVRFSANGKVLSITKGYIYSNTSDYEYDKYGLAFQFSGSFELYENGLLAKCFNRNDSSSELNYYYKEISKDIKSWNFDSVIFDLNGKPKFIKFRNQGRFSGIKNEDFDKSYINKTIELDETGNIINESEYQ